VKIKLNEKRTTWVTVALPDGNDGFESFQVEFALTDDDKALVVDLIVGVKGLELEDETGNLLTPKATIEWLKANAWVKPYLLNAWMAGNEKSLAKQKTFLGSQKS